MLQYDLSLPETAHCSQTGAQGEQQLFLKTCCESTQCHLSSDKQVHKNIFEFDTYVCSAASSVFSLRVGSYV